MYMKKLFCIFIFFLIIFILYNIYIFINPINRPLINNDTYSYKCLQNQYNCKAYFIPTSDIYFYSYNYKNNITNEEYTYVGNAPLIHNKNIFYKDTIKLHNGTILLTKLNFKYDNRLDGTYLYNEIIYSIKNHIISFENYDSSTPIRVINFDKDIIYISNDFISNPSIYKYDFDLENNLILYPLYSDSINSNNKLSYKLKRLH